MYAMNDITINKDNFCISTDKSKLDITIIHHYLSKEAYWSLNIPLERVQKSINNSLCYGVYYNDQQIGFARVITDFASFAYIADVFILNEYRGKGLSKWLVETMITHPELQDLRRWALRTRDAHGLYNKFGFADISDPEKWMELDTKKVY